ncbi:hypothetical protein HDZ31DRAFT_61412 [Schizophyllum fasciatum]
MVSDWGFNFRHGYLCDEDGSDTDADDVPAKTETDLIRDFDLGSRDEGGIKYKPNPFSIAKINAAARTATQSKPLKAPVPSRARPADKKGAGGTIEQAFKVQAARGRTDFSPRHSSPVRLDLRRPQLKPRLPLTPTPAAQSSASNYLQPAMTPLRADNKGKLSQTMHIRPVNKLATATRSASPAPGPSSSRPSQRPPTAKTASGNVASTPSHPSRKRAVQAPASSVTKPPSAYSASFGDADEEWTTLAAPMPKRRKTEVHTSAPFRLPGLLGRPGPDSHGAVRKSGVSPSSRRRVITFLPPPMGGGSSETGTRARVGAGGGEGGDGGPVSDGIPADEATDEGKFRSSPDCADEGREEVIMEAQPSTPRSLSPAKDLSSSPTLVGNNTVKTPLSKYRCLSRGVGESDNGGDDYCNGGDLDDLHTPVDLEGMRLRFPALKKRLRSVRL